MTYRRRNFDAIPKNKSGIQYFYQGLVGWGILVTVGPDGNLIIQSPTGNVSPRLREAIEKRKVALVKHIRNLSATEQVQQDFDTIEQIEF